MLAISDEEDAHDRLTAFREGRGDVLVTVAMASVGFDVPDCTHMALFTPSRSWVQLLQTIMRVGRIDWRCTAEASQQFGYVWAPKDKKFDEFMSWLRSEMDMGMHERAGRENAPDAPDDRTTSTFVPIGGTLGDVTYESLDGALSNDDAKVYEAICRSDPALAAWPPEFVVRVVRARDAVHDFGSAASSATPASVRTPTERMDELRAQCHQIANRVDALRSVEFGTTERQMSQLFGNVRARTMTQLDESLRWVAKRLREENEKRAGR